MTKFHNNRGKERREEEEEGEGEGGATPSYHKEPFECSPPPPLSSFLFVCLWVAGEDAWLKEGEEGSDDNGKSKSLYSRTCITIIVIITAREFMRQVEEDVSLSFFYLPLSLFFAR